MIAKRILPYSFHFPQWILFLAFCSLSLAGLEVEEIAEIRYLTTPTIPFDWEVDITDTSEILDTLSGKVIYQVNSHDGIPLYFYQEVRDDVCFDKKCRPIDLKIYWNITGRYFGFGLEHGEFLSRREHKAFDNTDYLRLHTLLADPMLPFGNISFEQLVNINEQKDDLVDGVTGATSKNLSQYVVDGAAYTTYLLWTTIHGPTKEIVKLSTERQLNDLLLLKILESTSSLDRIWALKKIRGSDKIEAPIEEKLIELIAGEDFFVSYTAINCISSSHLQSDYLQNGLFSVYARSKSNNIRKPIIEKLYSAPVLNQELLLKSYELLPKLNGNEVSHWLKLYSTQAIADELTCAAVVKILKNENRFIANKAFEFLDQLKEVDQETKQALRTFKTKSQ